MILDSNKSFLLILVFSALIVGVITIYCAVNHQQKIDNQIVSGTIHMLNTTNDGVEPSFKVVTIPKIKQKLVDLITFIMH